MGLVEKMERLLLQPCTLQPCTKVLFEVPQRKIAGLRMADSGAMTTDVIGWELFKCLLFYRDALAGFPEQPSLLR